LLPAGEVDEIDGGFVDVPPDDYRAIRRAILDVSSFSQNNEPAETSRVGPDVPASNDATTRD